MSFISGQTRLLIPRSSDYYASCGDYLWIGQGIDSGLVGFKIGSKYMITKNRFACDYIVDGDRFTPVYSVVNNYIYWQDNTGYQHRYLYYSDNYGWIICRSFPGYEPYLTWDNETLSYVGSIFYSGNLPKLGEQSSFRKRGDGNNEENLTVRVEFPRWECDNEFGEYKPFDGETGNKFLGTPIWRDNYGAYYDRSFEKINNNYEYGDIKFSNNKWIIGLEGSYDGWHEGSEPKVDGNVVFTFKKNENSDAIGYNKVISFCKYGIGTKKSSGFLGEVAIWR